MNQEIFVETSAWLMERAKKFGHPVTKDQLKRWRAEGVLPRPQQIPVLDGRGTQAVYPTGTLRQLLALQEAIKRKRNIDEAGWLLWLNGYPVDEKHWKPYLTETAMWVDKWIPKIRQVFYGSRGADLTEEGWDGIEHLEHVTFKDNPFNDVRMRARFTARDTRSTMTTSERAYLMHENFETFIIPIIWIIAGKFQIPDIPKPEIKYEDDVHLQYDDDARDEQKRVEILDRATGIYRARTDRFCDVGPVTQQSSWHGLKMASAVFKKSFDKVLAQHNDDTLLQARDELIGAISTISMAHGAFGKLFDKNAFGFGVLVKLFYFSTKRVQALLFLGWLNLRQFSDTRDGTQKIFAERSSALSAWQAYCLVGFLRKELPEFADTLSNKRFRKIINNPHELELLRKEVQKIADTIPQRIQEFRNRNLDISRKIYLKTLLFPLAD